MGHFHNFEGSLPGWRKIVSNFYCLNFLQEEIANLEALGANVVCVTMPSCLLVLC
jgi:hypothetical protein